MSDYATIDPLFDSIIALWHGEDDDGGGDEHDILTTFGAVPPQMIRPYLAHPRSAYRAVAVAALGCLDEKAAVPAIYELLEDPDSWVYELTCWALGRLDPYWGLYDVWAWLLVVLDAYEADPVQMELF